MSGFDDWVQAPHADEYVLYPENMGEHLSIDEVALSKGELYTIVTNKRSKSCHKKSVVAIINGTQAKTIQGVLEKIPLSQRELVKEVSMDMARNMGMASKNSFPESKSVIDRFHVVRLVQDALQHLRIQHRWDALEAENKSIKESKAKGEKYSPEILSNGDTLKELLARSRYLLYKFKEEWTTNQSERAALLFEKYPALEAAYKLTISFRSIYENTSKEKASEQFKTWKEEVIALDISQFSTAVHTIEYHWDAILNFFDNRSTNAYAESFNSKIKGFRANLRGVSDVKFFLFRLEKLFA